MDGGGGREGEQQTTAQPGSIAIDRCRLLVRCRWIFSRRRRRVNQLKPKRKTVLFLLYAYDF